MSKAPKRIWDILEKLAKSTPTVRSSRHAAAICHKGGVLAYGVNSYKTHPMMLVWGKNEKSLFLHAEIDAITDCIKRHGSSILPKCSLYVLRVDKRGNVTTSCPCSGCQRAIKAFGIKKVFHT